MGRDTDREATQAVQREYAWAGGGDSQERGQGGIEERQKARAAEDATNAAATAKPPDMREER